VNKRVEFFIRLEKLKARERELEDQPGGSMERLKELSDVQRKIVHMEIVERPTIPERSMD
jgi:hypothetical protein